MTRTEQYLAILRNQVRGTLQGQDPVDRALRTMLVHAAFADGIVNDDEFELLERLFPDLPAGEVLMWVANTAERQLDTQGLLEQFPSADERTSLLDLAREMVAIDQTVDPKEHQFLNQLIAACQGA